MQPPTLQLAPGLILQLDAYPDAQNHRYRQGLFEGSLPPVNDSVTLSHVIHRADGSTQELAVTVRIDTPIEIEYYRHGGILPYVLRQLLES